MKNAELSRIIYFYSYSLTEGITSERKASLHLLSDFVLVKDHVRNSVYNWIFSFAVHANQLALHDMSLNRTIVTSRIIRWSFFRFY
jgi:hypothetical protein